MASPYIENIYTHYVSYACWSYYCFVTTISLTIGIVTFIITIVIMPVLAIDINIVGIGIGIRIGIGFGIGSGNSRRIRICIRVSISMSSTSIRFSINKLHSPLLQLMPKVKAWIQPSYQALQTGSTFWVQVRPFDSGMETVKLVENNSALDCCCGEGPRVGWQWRFLGNVLSVGNTYLDYW